MQKTSGLTDSIKQFISNHPGLISGTVGGVGIGLMGRKQRLKRSLLGALLGGGAGAIADRFILSNNGLVGQSLPDPDYLSLKDKTYTYNDLHNIVQESNDFYKSKVRTAHPTSSSYRNAWEMYPNTSGLSFDEAAEKAREYREKNPQLSEYWNSTPIDDANLNKQVPILFVDNALEQHKKDYGDKGTQYGVKAYYEQKEKRIVGDNSLNNANLLHELTHALAGGAAIKNPGFPVKSDPDQVHPLLYSARIYDNGGADELFTRLAELKAEMRRRGFRTDQTTPEGFYEAASAYMNAPRHGADIFASNGKLGLKKAFESVNAYFKYNDEDRFKREIKDVDKLLKFLSKFAPGIVKNDTDTKEKVV